MSMKTKNAGWEPQAKDWDSLQSVKTKTWKTFIHDSKRPKAQFGKQPRDESLRDEKRKALGGLPR